MNTKIIAAFVVAIALVTSVGMVSAASQTNTYLQASGVTSMTELVAVGGFDWSECSYQDTAMVDECVEGTGDIMILKTVRNPGPWEMQESKVIVGDGDFELGKSVYWWTEDSTIECNEMKWPTVANIFVQFDTEIFSDLEEIHNIANAPVEDPVGSGQFSPGVFLKEIYTDDPFVYVESVGINMPTYCVPEMPTPCPMPEC